jgi:prepilin-type N-terminal cleavage/methylation domain-containing protein
MMMPSQEKRSGQGKASSKGFSLLELLVAMAVFLVISAVSFELFSRHQALLSEEQLTVGLNIGLRNALAQIQLDVANAGNGLIVGGQNIPAWPVGVTIENSNPTSSQCNPQGSYPPVYASACFDQLNIIVVDPNTPPLHPCATTGCTQSTSGANSLIGQFPTGSAAATYYNHFNLGDEVLFVQSCAAAGGKAAAQSSGCMFTTAILTSAGTLNTTAPGCAAGCVSLTYNATQAGGGNPACPIPTPSPNTCNDPLNMTSYAPAGELTDSYAQADWVVRLLPITYSVNASNVDSQNNSDPQLVRTQNNNSYPIMDQIIAFKVGAALWNNENTSTFQYNYNAANYSTGTYPNLIPAPYQFNLIRSVRASIIGRTEPNPTNPYRNSFDNGPYEIRGNSIIVDPRNLTMNGD